MIPGHGRGVTTPGPPLCGVSPPRLTAVGVRRTVRGQVLALLLPLLAVLIAALWWVLETGEGTMTREQWEQAEAELLQADADDEDEWEELLER